MSDESHNSSSSSEDDVPTEEYLIVEETLGSCISPVIRRQWLVPNERAYWYPGAKSDGQHLKYLHANLEKNEETENKRNKKGELVYNWQKVPYNEILKQGNDLRRLQVSRSQFSESEATDREKKEKRLTASKKNETGRKSNITSDHLKKQLAGTLSLPSNVKAVPSASTGTMKPRSFNLQKRQTRVDTAISANDIQNKPMTNITVATKSCNPRPPNEVHLSEKKDSHEHLHPNNTPPAEFPSTVAQRPSSQPQYGLADHLLANVSCLDQAFILANDDAVYNNGLDNHQEDNTYYDNILGAGDLPPFNVGEVTGTGSVDDVLPDHQDLAILLSKAITESDSSSTREVGSVGKMCDTGNSQITFVDERPPAWALQLMNDVKSLLKEVEMLKARTGSLPLISRSIGTISADLKLVKDGIDETSRSRSAAKDATDGEVDCTLILGHLPLMTETDMDAFEGRLKTDAIFRKQFNVWLERMRGLSKGSDKDGVVVQRTLRALCDESVTTFGNWSGVKKVVRYCDQKRKPFQEIVKCKAFKNMEMFTTLTTFFGSDKYIKEWVRNTNGTRIRYHDEKVKLKKAKLAEHTHRSPFKSPHKQQRIEETRRKQRQMANFQARLEEENVNSDGHQQQTMAAEAQNCEEELETFETVIPQEKY